MSTFDSVQQYGEDVSTIDLDESLAAANEELNTNIGAQVAQAETINTEETLGDKVD